MLKQLIRKIKEEYSYEKDYILPVFCQYKDVLEKNLMLKI
ncbi:TPA: hypothetical protein ACF3LY_001776 [Escherichia coli]